MAALSGQPSKFVLWKTVLLITLSPMSGADHRRGRRLKLAALGTIPVTDNLFAALDQVRPDRAPYWIRFWVDALCIDQRHDLEKATQIPMMRHIYSRARKVYIFLGELPDGQAEIVQEAYVLINRLGSM